MRALGGRVGGLALLMALTLMDLTACGTKTGPEVSEDPVPSSAAVEPAFEDVSWEDWTATYRDVRPAADPALEELADRVRALNETSWTAELGPRPITLVYTPELVRAEMVSSDVYMDPRSITDRESPLTVCTETCVETSLAVENPGAEGGSIPEEFSAVLYALSAQVTVDQLVDQVRDYGRAFLATVDSPIGALDCFLVGPEGTTPEDIEGEDLVLDPASDGFTPAVCADERGLLFSPPGGNLAPRYETWTAGVEGVLEPSPAVEPEASEEPNDEPSDEPSEPQDIPENVSWEGWEPAYRDTRMATQADVTELSARIDALNASEWTATLPDGAEVAVGPEHVRATLLEGAHLHLDPRSLGSFVLCVGDDGCVEEQLGGQEQQDDILTPMATYFAEAVRAQRTSTLRVTDDTAYAVLDSPVGELDCLVGLGGRNFHNLEGVRPALSEEEPTPGTLTEDRVCVDEHGLVLLGRLPQAPVLDVLDWRPGVPAGFDEHPTAEQP